MEEIKVLVVDDEPDFLESLVRRLTLRKLAAQGVDSGEKALDYLAAYPVDVVVLDVKMGGMDGIAALKEIKAKHPKVEVILLTGHASVDSGMTGLAVGAFDYLIKPVKLDDLLERIREAHEHAKLSHRHPGA